MTAEMAREKPLAPKALEILETTLRDGSYSINFQFSAADTEKIATALERLGFDWIEIGHGVGLNASNRGFGKAAESDEGYLKAAARSLKRAKFGMFCIPGIARLEDIDMAAEHGMKFIRIGTEVSRVEESKPFVERAKKYGMLVTSNFMKSYTLPPKDFALRAKLSQSYGADVVYLVDSAGGMFPEQVANYIHAIQDLCDVRIGFHGHNNLELAVANSLVAAENGTYMIDTSLQGMGRSSGNTPTEVFLLVMKRKGYSLSMDPLATMDVSEKYIRPLIRRHGYDSLDMICGFSEFHSSYMGIIREYSGRYGVDPRKLIMSLCEHDKVNAPRTLVESLAQKLRDKEIEVYSARFSFDLYYGAEQESDDDK